MLTDTVDLFAALGETATATTITQGHGRRERRTIRVSADLVDYSDMPGLAQVAEIRTQVTMLKTGATRDQGRYLFPSLPPAQASPQRLLALRRGHWRIEHTLFPVKDDSFGEDRHVLPRRPSAETLCARRNAAMTLLRGASPLWRHDDPMTARAQYVAAHPLAVVSPSGCS